MFHNFFGWEFHSKMFKVWEEKLLNAWPNKEKHIFASLPRRVLIHKHFATFSSLTHTLTLCWDRNKMPGSERKNHREEKEKWGCTKQRRRQEVLFSNKRVNSQIFSVVISPFLMTQMWLNLRVAAHCDVTYWWLCSTSLCPSEKITMAGTLGKIFCPQLQIGVSPVLIYEFRIGNN